MQKFQRDKFIEIVSKNLEKNKNIFFLSADFGAPALDQLREKFKSNFIHLGISEQNMVDVNFPYWRVVDEKHPLVKKLNLDGNQIRRRRVDEGISH